MDYGWLTAIAKPLFWLLDALHGVVGNWGWAIVLLTILVKLAFFPLQAASYRSMAKMRKVTPKLTALRERYGNDRVKMNQAMMELYKTEKINPLGGCLPIVVQIPVFIALYWVLLASVEIRNAPWIGWIQDLSTPDPWYILPVVMAATMFIQTKLNPDAAGSAAGEDDDVDAADLLGDVLLLPGRPGAVLGGQQPVLDRPAVGDHPPHRGQAGLRPCASMTGRSVR